MKVACLHCPTHSPLPLQDNTASSGRFLFVKHSEGWNVDRCSCWMETHGYEVDWCYPVSDSPFPDPQNYRGVIVFGGAPSANDTDQFEWARQELRFIENCLKAETPFFGICLGAQMLARVLGANVYKHPDELTEIGFFEVEPVAEQSHFLTETLTVMQWHREGFELPTGATHLASSERFPNQAFSYGENNFGVQFHPEVNPEVLHLWHERNKTREQGVLTEAQRRVQRCDALEHDANISRWLDNFLSDWTADSQQVLSGSN